jgi:hypothetical protein
MITLLLQRNRDSAVSEAVMHLELLITDLAAYMTPAMFLVTMILSHVYSLEDSLR